MLVVKTQPNITVAIGEGTVLTVQGNAAESKIITIENLDLSSTLTYRFQSSSDGVTWTDVASDTTLAPTAHIDIVLDTFVYHRLRASGNLIIAAQVQAHQSFNAIFSFVNL